MSFYVAVISSSPNNLYPSEIKYDVAVEGGILCGLCGKLYTHLRSFKTHWHDVHSASAKWEICTESKAMESTKSDMSSRMKLLAVLDEHHSSGHQPRKKKRKRTILPATEHNGHNNESNNNDDHEDFFHSDDESSISDAAAKLRRIRKSSDNGPDTLQKETHSHPTNTLEVQHAPTTTTTPTITPTITTSSLSTMLPPINEVNTVSTVGANNVNTAVTTADTTTNTNGNASSPNTSNGGIAPAKPSNTNPTIPADHSSNDFVGDIQSANAGEETSLYAIQRNSLLWRVAHALEVPTGKYGVRNHPYGGNNATLAYLKKEKAQLISLEDRYSAHLEELRAVQSAVNDALNKSIELYKDRLWANRADFGNLMITLEQREKNVNTSVTSNNITSNNNTSNNITSNNNTSNNNTSNNR